MDNAEPIDPEKPIVASFTFIIRLRQVEGFWHAAAENDDSCAALASTAEEAYRAVLADCLRRQAATISGIDDEPSYGH